MTLPSDQLYHIKLWWKFLWLYLTDDRTEIDPQFWAMEDSDRCKYIIDNIENKNIFCRNKGFLLLRDTDDVLYSFKTMKTQYEAILKYDSPVYYGDLNLIITSSKDDTNSEKKDRLIVSALQNPTLQLIIYLPEIDRLGIYDTLAATGEAIRPNQQLKRLLLAQLPQVTVRGFGAGGFFHALANDLPEPAMLDEVSERARQLEVLLKQATNIQVSKKPAGTADVEEAVAAAEAAPAPGKGFEDLL